MAFKLDLTNLQAAQSGTVRLILVKIANATRSQIGFYEDNPFSGFVFYPNGKLLAFTFA